MYSDIYTAATSPRTFALFATGIFSGTTFCVSYASIPAILASKDPLPAFVQTYKKGATIAISIVISAISNGACYYYLKDPRFIWSGFFSFLCIPITKFLIMPINNQLFAMEKLGDDYDRNKVYQLVNKWSSMHALRTLSAFVAFAIHVLY
ncbi:hypothetical protein A0J61_03975 [Choanephora cucurbitarum]|uniref:DUF1772 domain-containing protein n=1 Tax=Choanephora cucurbitarum TaxID=101091 RepID=A0A1C7NHF3_9FUNG|nr:hypothetical protein A0J61_03975 [Choanephora cucurbitarum]